MRADLGAGAGLRRWRDYVKLRKPLHDLIGVTAGFPSLVNLTRSS